MIAENMSPAGAPASAQLLCQARPTRRILVVEDDGDIRRINTEVLTQSGYQVDAAEDGAAAWDTLQRQRYDLMVTDNDMPKVSGGELRHKLHAARMALPVIMATGQLPRELTLSPWLQPAALLFKPYTFAELLGTVRNVLGLPVLVAMLLLGLPAAIHAQNPLQPPSGLRSLAFGSTAQASAPVFSAAGNGAVNARVATPVPPLALLSPDSPAQPSAMTVSVRGKCEYSEDGVTFASLATGHVFEQGAIVRTGQDGRADVFFRRTGTTVRLQAGTELRIEKMTLELNDGLPLVHTLLDLRTGRIFTVVRSAVAGSTLEIRNAAGRAVVEGSGIGRYIITADGAHVVANGSVVPLKVIGENGITVVAAGEQFDKKDGKMLPASPSAWVKDLVELDELQAATADPVAKEPSLKP
ncbi:MAG TPA: response regulator [Candidatus Acidoferrum sp.]|nr:response regulator [Candidatus Acidoferrum sp.]